MKCKAGTLPLVGPDADLFTGWCLDGSDTTGRRVSAVLLSAALAAEGHVVSPTALKDHRGGRCVCYRAG